MPVPMEEDRRALAALVAASRRLGEDPRMVLHGGGNTSVKTSSIDADGSKVPVLWVKGSGHDLATISPSGFAPLRLGRLRRLLPPVVVPEEDLHNELRCALLDANAPDPSVESLVHALLPAPAVMHSHADALLTVGSARGSDALAELLGPHVLIADYAMPGPHLVASVSRAWADANDATIGVMVLGHGLFTVGANPDEALARHLDLVERAELVLPEPRFCAEPCPAPPPAAIAALRAEICDAVGLPVVVRSARTPTIAELLADGRALEATDEGPITPDHAIWTKPWPLIGTDVAAFARRYTSYVDRNARRAGRDVTPLDPAPRVVIDAGFGMLTVGRTAREAAAVADLYEHTALAILRAQAFGGYRGPGEEHIFDLEYWSFQQEKLRRTDTHAPMAGQVAVVTGAASGIGRGCASALLDQGCSVIGWDLSPAVSETFDSDDYLGIAVDVTDAAAVSDALRRGVEAFGGLDVLVVAAGIFPGSAHLGDLDMDHWRRAMAVNVESVAELYGQSHELLALARPYGRVVLIASKNVLAPGPGAAAYSASKAAVTQLTRVAALEWAGEGIRLNMMHPDAVFDTGLWTPQLLAARAEHYGMSVEDYKRRNLLQTEVTSAKVGALCVAMCGPAFECTTGAQIPVDGGSDRVI